MINVFRNGLFVSFILILLNLSAACAQGTLRVSTGTFYPVDGKAVILVFDSTVSSLGSKNASRAIRRYVVPVSGAQFTFAIDSLKKGRYVIEVFHDNIENGTHQFAREDYGFTGVDNDIGPPRFRSAAFYYHGGDQEIFIPLENEFAHKQHIYINKLAFTPVFGYAPETSVLLGANMFKLFRHKGYDSVARTSYADALAVGTFHSQVILEQNYLVFTRQEKWMITGFTGFSRFPQSYYGIGNQDTRAGETVNYSQFRFEHLFMRKIYKKFFAGIGYRYSNLFHLSYSDSSRFTTNPVAGSHGAVSSGVQLAIASDNRDNVYNTSQGHLIRVKATFNTKALGSGFDYDAYEIDFRQFVKPFNRRRDVLAFQVYGYLSAGNVPWSEMGTLGSDMIMRGYYSGRYRDKTFVAGQAEYRRSFNKMFGAVLFAGVGEVGGKINSFTSRYLKPNAGAGGRMTLDRKERLNLRLDVGFGQHTSNVYFTLAEAF